VFCPGPKMTKIEAALTYASWGWHIIPVVPNGKVPATAHGVNDATTNPEQITRWWAQNPDYNIGIAAGEKSRILVFDIDPRNGGNESWEQWIAANGAPPDGLLQLTAGGGQHFVMRYTPELKSCKLSDGIDLLTDGRYFVAYPSTIEGRNYEWEASSDPFDGVAPTGVSVRWLDAYKVKHIAHSERHHNATPGGALMQGGRNSGLTALGGAMRRYGMTEAEIMAALAIANEERCEIPLPSSELAQIVKSVSRYAPDSDIAADTALGSEAADALLATEIVADTQDYFFTRASSFLDQPAPLRWVIKHWIPDNAATMIFGESGCGKTFLAIDMACCIATGKEWHGHKTKPGLVIYMAGEGNYGLRQRVASWCKDHGVSSMDNLLISNRAIDLDGPAVAAHILNAVRELTKGDAVMIFVDTLNNHMSGDENSARDFRALLNAAQIVARALSAAVAFVHHNGLATDAKARARGSSAIKGSLDSQILVKKADESIEVICTKMKDTEEPQPIFGKLKQVSLDWFDEDGDEIKGAVFAIDDNPSISPKKESDISKDIKKFTNAWWATSAEERNGSPYLARSALLNYLIENDGVKESSAKIYIRESQKGRLIYNLLNAGIIQAFEHGWVVSDGVTASSMMIRKGEK